MILSPGKESWAIGCILTGSIEPDQQKVSETGFRKRPNSEFSVEPSQFNQGSTLNSGRAEAKDYRRGWEVGQGQVEGPNHPPGHRFESS